MNKYSGSNFKEFVSRMESSLGAKRELLTNLNIGDGADAVIVDFGAGSGLLGIQAAIYYPFAQVILVERNADMRRLIKNNIYEAGLSNIKLVKDLSNIAEGSVDVLLLSSVLHEVYADAEFSTLGITDFFKGIKPLMKRGGILRIREGLEINTKLYSTFTVKDIEHFKTFVREWERLGGGGFYVNLDKDKGQISGNIPQILEFLNKYTWGIDSLPREINEKVLLYTLEGWFNILSYVSGITIRSAVSRKDVSYLDYVQRLVEDTCDWDTHVLLSLVVD